jgi:hypothetical protein
MAEMVVQRFSFAAKLGIGLRSESAEAAAGNL